jgi:hypothetical protein
VDPAAARILARAIPEVQTPKLGIERSCGIRAIARPFMVMVTDVSVVVVSATTA